MSLTRAERDVELWRAWRADPSPLTTEPLLDSIEPIIETSVRSVFGRGLTGGRMRIPRVVVKGMANNIALKQLETNYHPDKSQINTYLTNYLSRKLAPELNKYQNIVRIPHGKAKDIKPIQMAATELEERLQRHPSDLEIADHLKLPEHHVQAVRHQASQRDYIASKAELETGLSQTPFQRALRQTYIDLPSQDRALFDLWVKQNKKPDELMNMMSMNRRQLAASQTRIRSQLSENLTFL